MVQTPAIEAGTLPSARKAVSGRFTVPRRRCLHPPTVFVTAAYAMSEPIAVVGAVPNRRIRTGVIREPPPMPVIPTSRPIPNPATTSSGSMGPYSRQLRRDGRGPSLALGLDQDVGDLRSRELLGRALAGAQHLAHLRARQEDPIVGPGRAGLAGRHALRDLAVEGVVEHKWFDS